MRHSRPWPLCLTAAGRGNHLRARCLVVVVADDSKVAVAGQLGAPPRLAGSGRRDSGPRPSIRRRGTSPALQRGT